MNTRILTSVLTIIAVVAAVSAMTWAFFSDAGTSTGNIFTAGTLDLQLDDDNETFSNSVSDSVMGPNMSPGSSVTDFISLHNAGSIDIAEVEFGATRTAHDGDSDLLENVLNLTVKTGSNNTCSTSMVDHTTAINNQIGGGAGHPKLTLAELIAADYDSLPGLTVSPSAGDTYYLCLTVEMDSLAGNAYQGDSVTVSFDFTANQDISQ